MNDTSQLVDRQRVFSWLIALGTTATLGAFTFAVLQPGCGGGACEAYSPMGQPAVSPQCPSGYLCYNGGCRRACQGGAEDFSVTCTTDDDCPDPSFPHCASVASGRNYCTSCSGEETCVPQLNICAPIGSLMLPPQEPGTIDPSTVPLRPLDSGPIDGYSFGRDAEVVTFPNIPFTHTGTVYVQRVEENGQTRSAATVVFYDLRQTRRIFGSYRNSLQDCEVQQLEGYAGPPPQLADLGDVVISSKSDTPGAIRVDMRLEFDGTRYAVTSGTIAPDNITLSTLQLEYYVALFGAGTLDTTGPCGTNACPWPTPVGEYHIPFQLVPSDESLNMVRNGVVVPADPVDLLFTWTAVPYNFASPGELVEVEITGQSYRLFCRYNESIQGGAQQINLAADLLRDFRTREGATGQTLRLEMRRAFHQGLGFSSIYDDAGVPQTAFEGFIYVSHTYRGTISF